MSFSQKQDTTSKIDQIIDIVFALIVLDLVCKHHTIALADLTYNIRKRIICQLARYIKLFG